MTSELNKQPKHILQWENIGLILALIPSLSFISLALSLMVGIKISPLHFPISLLITFLIVFFSSKPNTFVSIIVSCILLLVLIVSTTYLATNFYDISYDGQWYHSQAVIALNDGWNPFYGRYHSDLLFSQNYPIWLNHYPNGSGYAKAILFSITGKIESIKAINLWLIIASYIIVNLTLKGSIKLHSVLRIIFCIIITLNPIALGEMFSNYVDGQLYSILLIILCLLIKYVKENKAKYLVFGVFLAIYLINIKFSAVVYVGLLFFSLCIYFAFSKKWNKILAVFLIAGMGFLAGVVGLGYPTYVKNYTEKGHPFYPVAGQNKIDVGKILYPSNFYGLSSAEKFFRSNLGQHGFSRAPQKTELRWPFYSFHLKNMDAFRFHVSEISGFGPGNNEIFVLWLIGLPLFLIAGWKSKTHRILLTIMLVTAVTVFANPEAWVARYSPQFYICFALLGLGFVVYKQKAIKIFGYVFLTLMLTNLVIISCYYIPAQIESSKTINNTLTQLKMSNNNMVRFGHLVSHRERFKEANIVFTESTDAGTDGFTEFPFSFGSTYYRIGN